MSLNIPLILDALIGATADKTNAEARIAQLRASLETVARHRLATEGAAPSWNTPGLGKVRLDPDGEWKARVSDDAQFGEYVAEHTPEEAMVALYFTAAQVTEVIQALAFINVRPAKSRIEVRPAYRTALLDRVEVDVTEPAVDDDGIPEGERMFLVTDPVTGEVIPGLTGTRKAATLVVTLDKARKTQALDEAALGVSTLLDSAAVDDDVPNLDLDQVHANRVALEALTHDQLQTIARARELSATGTKAILAERIARAEVTTGQVIRPAATVEAEVEEPTAHLAENGGMFDHTADVAAAAKAIIDTKATREDLRLLARSKGLPIGVTKADVALNLAEAGITAEDVKA